MIRRSNVKKAPSAVNAAESETLSVSKGIVRNSGPGDLACVVDSCNFRLREDGSYALRKPDVYLKGFGDAAFPMNDGKGMLYVKDGKLFLQTDMLKTEQDVYLKYRPYNSNSYTYVYFMYAPHRIRPSTSYAVFDDVLTPIENVSVYIKSDSRMTRAGDVSVIQAYIDASVITDLVDPSLYQVGGAMLPRLLSIYIDEDFNGRAVAEIIEPEPNTIPTSESSDAFKPNAMLDNPYAIKDLYGYGSVGVQGIVAYQDPSANDSEAASSSYVMVGASQSSKTVTLKDSLFKVDVRNWTISVYTNAHISLVEMSKCAGPNASPTSASALYAMDGELQCGVVQITVQRSDSPTASTVLGDVSKRCSAFIPAYTPLARADLGAQSGVNRYRVVVRVYLYKDGSSGTTTLYAYPASASVDALYKKDPVAFSVSAYQYIDIAVTLDALGNLVDEMDGFRLGLDDKGVYLEAIDDYVEADLYSLAFESFASETAARNAAVPYSQGAKTYFDMSSSEWTFYYYRWDYPSGSTDYDGLDDVMVKELTETVYEPTFKMVTALNAASEKPLVLKAVMTFSKSMPNYYGVWETSSDGGITWKECPEFLRLWRGYLVAVPVVDETYSGETLTSAYDYVKYVKCAPLTATDNSDLAANRIDVLAITQTPKTNLFRFSVYRYEVSATPEAITPMCIADVYTGIDPKWHLPCPKRFNTYVTGTCMYPYTDIGGSYGRYIALFFPNDTVLAGKTPVIKFGVTDDVSKILSDADCDTVISNVTNDDEGFGIVCVLLESAFIESNACLTHEVRVRVAVFVEDVAVPGYSIDILYMHVSGSIADFRERDTAAVHLDKFTTFPEPIVRITSESGKLTYSSNNYPFENYNPLSQASFPSGGGYAIQAQYRVDFSITNPSNVYMLVALSSDSPDANVIPADVFPIVDSAFVSSNSKATVTIDGSAQSFYFKANNYKRVRAAIERGNSIVYKLIAPHQNAVVSYEYRLSTNVLGNVVVGSVYVEHAIRGMSFPIVVTTMQGRITATCSDYPAFAKTAAWNLYWFNALNHASYYADEATYPMPAFALDDYSEDLPSLSANGTLTKYDAAESIDTNTTSYVPKAILTSFVPSMLKLVDTPTEYVDYGKMPQPTVGERLYYERRILTYGVKDFENTLFVSDPDSYITPLQNAVEFSYGSDITAIVPWRDYVMVFTENATYMLLKDSSSPSGFSTRTVNAQVGVPKSDGDSVQAILNGILFKSGDKAYIYIPGRYSTVDTMLNIRRISDPVEGLLEEGVQTLSFVQDDAWHLFQKRSTDDGDESVELIYDYARNVWTRNEHAFFPKDWLRYKASWTMLMADGSKLISYGKDFDEMRIPDALDVEYDLTPLSDISYGDFLGDDAFIDIVEDAGGDVSESLSDFDACVVPIQYSIDTGQRSSRFTIAKQFLEAKLNLMSLDDKDAFPFTICVYADGMPHAHSVDANTDSPLWRDSKTLDSGAVSTTFGGQASNNVGIMRQMFVKYSGRGKTLRITISGSSESRFAVYTVDSRYRVLPNKQ